MNALNATHDPALQSWLDSANCPDTPFPIQNLPFGVFRRKGSAERVRCAVAIGDRLLDIATVAECFEGASLAAARACGEPVLNDLMALGAQDSAALRARLSFLLSAANKKYRHAVESAMVPLNEAELVLPVRVAGYTDFFASIEHATNAGRLFRPDQPLLPNYAYVPIAYNGRANSLRVSGTPVTRPHGQTRPTSSEAAPHFAPTQRLDHEVELAALIGQPSTPGEPVVVGDAWRHIFGFCLLNDWSARDVQAWEYQPLGPFLGKSFATTLSPWVVTAEALAPFRVPVAARASGAPQPLPYLSDGEDAASGAVQVRIQAALLTDTMRDKALPAQLLSKSDAADLYWTFAQMVAHHTSNGSALDTGDVLGSGTVSGRGPGALGSMLEMTRNGEVPFTLSSGEQRGFLHDGDEITLTAHCERPGFRRIGFGECRARIAPARDVPKGAAQ